MANVLASLAATLALGVDKAMAIPVCSYWVVSPNEEDSEEDANAICAIETDKED